MSSTGLEVWVTDSLDQSRICRIPTDAILAIEWSESFGPVPTMSARLTLDRFALLDEDDPGSWVVSQLVRVETEIQIIYDGRVEHWGPVLSVDRTLGSPAFDVQVAGPEWWLGRRLVTGEIDVFGVEQIRTERLFDPPLDLGGTTRDWKLGLWFRRSDWRFTAEVYVDSSVPDDATVLFVGVNGGLSFPASRSEVTAGQLTRDAWTTAVIHSSFQAGGPASVGRTITVTVGDPSTSAGDILLRGVSAQVSPTSVGLDEPSYPWVVYRSYASAWLEIVGFVADFGFTPWVESGDTMAQMGWRRPDVYASEAAKFMNEAGGYELEFAANTLVRVARMWDTRGVEHAPSSLTLDDDTVVSWGSWSSGVERPVSEWVMANDEGFTGSFRDTSAFGGLLLQEFVAAPTGGAASGLVARAEQAAKQAATMYSESLSAVVDMSLVGELMVCDRVQVVLDDGPDQFSGLMRVQSRSVNPAAAGFVVELVPWVEGS